MKNRFSSLNKWLASKIFTPIYYFSVLSCSLVSLDFIDFFDALKPMDTNYFSVINTEKNRSNQRSFRFLEITFFYPQIHRGLIIFHWNIKDSEKHFTNEFTRWRNRRSSTKGTKNTKYPGLVAMPLVRSNVANFRRPLQLCFFFSLIIHKEKYDCLDH